MPVISTPRSTTSTSSNLYGTTTSSTDASSGVGSSSYSSRLHYLDRAGSLPKVPSSPSSYTSNYHSSYSSYTPRTPTTNRSYLSASSATYLSGGSSSLGTYRPSSLYFGSSGHDSTILCSRYGLNKKSTSSDILKKDGKSHDTKKPPSGLDSSGSHYRRLTSTGGGTASAYGGLSSGSGSVSLSGTGSGSGTSSSQSLARLVATSGLDIYEKYSPAHYKPNCDLSRSRSTTSNETAVTTNDDVDSRNEAKNSTLDRPRNRFNRLYSVGNDTDTTDSPNTNSYRSSYKTTAGKLANSSSATALSTSGHLSQSNSSSSLADVPIATFTLRGSRAYKSKNYDDDDSGGATATTSTLKNGISNDYNSSSNITINGIDSIKSARHQLKDLKVSATTSAAAAVAAAAASVAAAANGSDSNENNLNSGDATTITINNKNDLNSNVSGGTEVNSTATIKLDSPQLTRSNKSRSSSLVGKSTASPTSSAYRKYVVTSTASNNASDSNKLSSGDDKFEGLCGLKNIGNTCFMNSIIQCLSHTSDLTKFLRSHNALRSSNNNTKDQQILYEFSKLIREMWSGTAHCLSPNELKRAFSIKHRMYSDCSQQDAQEFLRFFLDSLHGGLNTGVKGELLKIDDNLSDNKKAELTWEWYARIENSVIRDLFVGQLKSTLRCTICGNSSVTFDPFWDLSVPLPSSSRCKLESCLDLFIREEVLDGDEMPTCSKCKTRRKCTKSLAIQRFPKYLVIHLKRFSETRWSKLSNIVEFPTGERELNMGSYGSNPHSNMHFSLYAISNHMGSTAGGHYVALCKHPTSRKWHEFNDNIISDSVPESHLVSSSAYILFYERA